MRREGAGDRRSAVNDDASVSVLAAFVVFSRIGACLLLMPGFSSPRIPVQVRLFIAVAVALALTPLQIDAIRPIIADGEPLHLLHLMGSELFIGAAIGLFGRVFFVALEFIGVAVAMSVGLSSNLGAPIEADETLPALTTLLTLAATALMFLTDLHLEVFRALQASYGNLPIADGFAPRFALDQLVSKSDEAFLLAVRIGSPFLIFSLVVNVALGLVGRLVPGIQSFFLSMPFLLIGGLILLSIVIKPMMLIFIDAFGHFLVTG